MSTANSIRLRLAPEHQRALLSTAINTLTAAVTGQRVEVPYQLPREIEDLPVMGAFVSLKRRGRLRSCCGFLGPQAMLLPSVIHAAERTAFDDPRFPPISASELPYLDAEIWLLENSQPIEASGEARRDAVVVGRHGLHVARGAQRGLLLPGVAVEHDMSAEQFLQQTCLKAGLPASAWKEDDTQVSTFEGHVIHGSLSEQLNQPVEASAVVTQEELSRLSHLCASNLRRVVAGDSPSYESESLADGSVNGVVVSLLDADGNEALQVSRVTLRERLPLTGTLIGLTENLAPAVERSTLRAEQLTEMQVAVMILSDPALHGAADAPDLRGLDPHRRLLLLKEHGRSFAVYDRRKSARQLLEEAVAGMGMAGTGQSMVVSLEVATTAPRLVVANVPRPEAGSPVRPPAQAGRFYPRSATELSDLVEQCLRGAAVKKQSWPAAMIPHAGLIYSGHIAANVLRRIQLPSTVIVIGPKHTRYGAEWAVAPHERWSVPGAELASDPALARRLSEAIPGLEKDAAAHRQEHAIEVELPFLARLAPRSRVVGIALGMADWPRCQQFATGLAKVIRTLPEPPLLLISSDMNHFASDAENRRLDEIALRAMETLDPQTLFETVTRERISMCGIIPATIVMETLRQLGKLRHSERTGYATSGDTTGDRSRVVGYAGMLLGA